MVSSNPKERIGHSDFIELNTQVGKVLSVYVSLDNRSVLFSVDSDIVPGSKAL